ncbi:unnamed protein product [Effrenium voratum]|nr:unnamed protein product [Effrenium voratum]
MAVTAARHGTRGAVACIVCQGLNPRQFLLLKRDGDLLAPRQRFGLPAVRLEAGEAVPVAAARAVEEECSLTADTLRWHPVPITASTSTWDSNADSFLVAYCFAWYSPPKESFPNPHEDRLRWMCRQSLKDLCLKQGLGLGFAREAGRLSTFWSGSTFER